MPKHSARSPSITSQESYKAVIISDLVAEVEVSQEELAMSLPRVRTNSGTDGNMSANLNFSNENAIPPDSSPKKANGSNISQGVILNAMQFGLSDSKLKEKSNQLSNSLSAAAIPKKSTAQEIKDMSVPRKIAFGFSFLPSILFVLCFAIILPCIPPPPCIETLWVKTFINSTATSSIQVLPNVVLFTDAGHDGNFLKALNFSSDGETVFVEKLPATATHLLCEKVTNGEQKDCIVRDETGKVYVHNGTTGQLLVDSVFDIPPYSQPILIPSCNLSSSLKAIAVAASDGQLEILLEGEIISRVAVKGCESPPSSLIPWTRGNSTDIVLICKKESKDVIVKVPQEKWCSNDSESEESSWSFDPQFDQTGFRVHPTEEGLVLWSGNDVKMISPDGLLTWKADSNTHTDHNRFIFYGSFIGKTKQIALLSSSIESKLQISLVNPANGKFTDKAFVADTEVDIEANDVIQLRGKTQDIFLLLAKAIPKIDVNETFDSISAISTTMMTQLSQNGFPSQPHFQKPSYQELGIMGFDGTYRVIEKLADTYSKVSMKALQDGNDLKIVLLRSLKEPSLSKETQVRLIKASGWDISAPQTSDCVYK